MPISPLQSLAIIFVTALCTFLTRALPFMVFDGKHPTPKLLSYLGATLPPAVIAILVIFCLKELDITSFGEMLPQTIAIIFVILLHNWKKNSLLSIGGGTILYMFLVQVAFKI